MKRAVWLVGGLLSTLILVLAVAHPVHAAERIYGLNKFQTAVQVAYKISPGTVNSVVLANGNSFADVLAGVPLARQKHAPLLYVDNTPDASGDALGYIDKHLARSGSVYILGGSGVVPDSFVSTLVGMGFDGRNIHRLAGSDRYGTAVAIAKEMQHSGTEFFLLSGENFPDALSASVAAALLGSVAPEEAEQLSRTTGFFHAAELGGVPVLLMPSSGSVPDVVVDYLNSISLPALLPQQFFNVVGGEAVVSNSVIDDLRSRVYRFGGVRARLAGADRYATSAAVNRLGFESYYANIGVGYMIPRLYVATGEDYADALCGAVLAALNHAPLVLAGDPLPAATEELLRHYRDENARAAAVDTAMVVIGSPSSIAEATVEQMEALFH